MNRVGFSFSRSHIVHHDGYAYCGVLCMTVVLSNA